MGSDKKLSAILKKSKLLLLIGGEKAKADYSLMNGGT